MLVAGGTATHTFAPAFQGQGHLLRSAGRHAPAFQGQRRLCRSAGRLANPWLRMLVTSDTAEFTARCRGQTSAGSNVSTDTFQGDGPLGWMCA